jgi:hypothetical protein
MDKSLIHYISPSRLETDVDLDKVLAVRFVRAIDQTTINGSNFILSLCSDNINIPINLTYNQSMKEVDITPVNLLLPETQYMMTIVGDSDSPPIVGVKDILGNGMVGSYTWTFVTGQSTRLDKPTLLTPMNQSALNMQPTLSWSTVSGADLYDIEVAIDSTFSQLYWPLGTDTWDSTQTSVLPSRIFEDNKEYFWRVRAKKTTGEVGVWSYTYNFFKGDINHGYVVPDDAPFIDVVSSTNFTPSSSIIDMISYEIDPPDKTYHIAHNTLTNVKVTFFGHIDQQYVNSTNFKLEGFANDGSNFTNNNNQWKMAKSAADDLSYIQVSGKIDCDIDYLYNPVTDITLVTLDPITPSATWLQNNLYELTIDLDEYYSSIIQSTFTTEYYPLFCGYMLVKREIKWLFPEATDDDIMMLIRDNSLQAAFHIIFPPEFYPSPFTFYSNSNSLYGIWRNLYRLPFNVDDPPFYVREYVRYKTLIDLTEHKYGLLIHDARSKMTLGDLTVENNTDTLRTMKQYMDNLKERLKPFEDKLLGKTRTGNAHPQCAIKSYFNMSSRMPIRGRLWR